jgi:hypothetical protein
MLKLNRPWVRLRFNKFPTLRYKNGWKIRNGMAEYQSASHFLLEKLYILDLYFWIPVFTKQKSHLLLTDHPYLGLNESFRCCIFPKINLQYRTLA